jgi:hypothetical protein
MVGNDSSSPNLGGDTPALPAAVLGVPSVPRASHRMLSLGDCAKALLPQFRERRFDPREMLGQA